MGKVTIELDPSWVTSFHSKKYMLVATFTGVSLTFAPVFLFLSGYNFGKESSIARLGWVAVGLLCFAVIYFVGKFYYRLAGEVTRELVRQQLI